MDLKALAAALFVAFFTVIMDAVFNFHYIYVLIILVITGYVLVRLFSISAAAPQAEAAPPSPEKQIELANLLKSAADKAEIQLVLESEDKNNMVFVNEKAFQQALAAGFAAFGIKVHGKTEAVRSGNQKLVHVTLTVNRKAGTIQEKLDAALSALRQLLSQKGGSAWQTDIPRKTELHILIPGN
ncbi:MAG: hypothetical protein GXO69_02330 [Acidobacteria bacterium]|nr:hypothetical protein [Acidobacteriota bacterium]